MQHVGPVTTLVNQIRKVWHSWPGLAVVVVGLAVALFFVVYGTTAAFSGDEWTATQAILAGGPLLIAMGGYLYSFVIGPHTLLCTSDVEIKAFMKAFIARGGSAHVVSGRLTWLREDEEVIGFILEQVHAGKVITIFAESEDAFPESLKSAAKASERLSLVVHKEASIAPRFTLLNFGRPGGATMAVARGVLPSHWIDIYDEHKHPQIIALARAYLERIGAAG